MRGKALLPIVDEANGCGTGCRSHATPEGQQERTPLTRIAEFDNLFRGKFGYHQPANAYSSLGIFAALRKHENAEARVLPISETRRLSRRLKRFLAGVLPFERFWSAFYRVGGGASSSNPLLPLDTVPGGAFHLVVSTGPRTAAANIAIARRISAKNVYFGFSRWPSDRFFTLRLTPERKRPHAHRAQIQCHGPQR